MCKDNPQTSQYMIIVNEDISNYFIHELDMFCLEHNENPLFKEKKEIKVTNFSNPKNVILLLLLNKDNNDTFNNIDIKNFINNFLKRIQHKNYNLNLIQVYKFSSYEQLLTNKF